MRFFGTAHNKILSHIASGADVKPLNFVSGMGAMLISVTCESHDIEHRSRDLGSSNLGDRRPVMIPAVVLSSLHTLRSISRSNSALNGANRAVTELIFLDTKHVEVIEGLNNRSI